MRCGGILGVYRRGSIFLRGMALSPKTYRSEVRFAKDNPPHKFAYMESEEPFKTYLAAAFGAFADGDEGKKLLWSISGQSP